jgi:hypothetical protein
MVAEGSKERHGRRNGCGCGCGGFVLVLTVGILLSLFHAIAGVGASLRIPFTDVNVTAAGSLGGKDRIQEGLPDYAAKRLGSNQDFINHSQSLTIWTAEGAVLVVIGRQPGSPAIDLHLVAR